MPDQPRARILIVDDEATQTKTLCRTLQDIGYDTAGFATGEEALGALREGSYDLLLTDLTMPGMDGIELLRAATEVDPHIVSVVMTGHGSIDTAVKAMKTGALDYVLKPFNLSAVESVLTRALEMRQLQVRNAALERELRERNAVLEAANDELDAFSSSIAHDLHAPTRHISVYARLVLDECAGQLSPEALKRLNIVAQSAEHLGRLIADLLAFSRLARSEMAPRPVDLNALVDQVRKELGAEMKDRSIVWRVAALPLALADEPMLRQAIYNLLSNAIKNTRGRNPAEIEIGGQVEGHEIVCYVRDNGAGFDMRYVDRLFGVFQCLHRSDEFEGTGAGLSIVRRIVERHGGRIWAEGKVQRGATFTFTLPQPPLISRPSLNQ